MGFRAAGALHQKIREVDPQATGKPFGTVEGLKAMKDGLQRAGIYAFLVIVAVLFLDFRNIGHTLLALTPLLLGVLMTLGMMGLLGVPLNPANMIAFPLILGVGVDNGVHVLHDYLLRRARRERHGQPRHRPGRAGQGADDDDRLRHADDLDGARPGRARVHSDAGRGLLDAVGARAAAGPAPDIRTNQSRPGVVGRQGNQDRGVSSSAGHGLLRAYRKKDRK